MESVEQVLNALADLLADRVAARLRDVATPAIYSQDAPPPGMAKRTYLDHCYRGSWPSRKAGRLRITTAADFNEWRTSRPVRSAKPAKVVEDIEDPREYLRKIGAR